MTTSTAQAEKILIYDGDCPMCRSTIAMLLGLRLVRPAQVRSNHDLDGPDLAAAQAAGLRNELVVLDPLSRETKSGTDALLWIIGDNPNHRLLVRLASLPGPRQLLRRGYQIISYNRRIISPPRQRIVCDCEPEVTLARRLSLIVPAALAAMLLVAGFGAALFRADALGTAGQGALVAVLAPGAGWMVMIVAAAALLRGEKRIDYIGHSAVTMLVGALVLVPATLAVLVVPHEAALVISVASLGVSLTLMTCMQRRRVEALKISRLWVAAWPVAVVAGMVAVGGAYYH